MKHSVAVELASEYVEWLRDCCMRIEVVGSVKRGDKEDVHDIEILLIADTRTPQVKFGQKVFYKTRLEERLAQFVSEGLLRQAHHKANGAKLKRFAIVEHSTDEEDFCLELWIVRAETWAIQNVIRTGPGDFSKRFVTNKEWGGLLPDKYQYIKGSTMIVERKTGLALPLLEEADALNVLGLGWIEPSERLKYAEGK